MTAALTAEQLAEIRAALLAALQYHGGDLDENPIERESEALAVVLEHGGTDARRDPDH